MAFTKEVRNQIARRAAGTDEVTGLPLHQAEAAHIDHSRNDSYFDEENGLFVNSITHWWLHLIDEDNGMTERGNQWARKQILQRVNPTPEEIEIFGAWMRRQNANQRRDH